VSARRRLLAAWRRFWFAPAPPDALGVGRAVVLGAVLALALRSDVSAWADVSSAFWMPISFFRLLPGPPRSREALAAVDAAWKLALALGCVGLFTRASTAVAFALSPVALGLPHCFGKLYHQDGIVVLVLAVLALSPCGDAFSLDRLLARRPPPRPSGDYRWPVRAVRLVMTLVFFGAGIAKLRAGGLAWAAPENLAALLVDQSRDRAAGARALGLALARRADLCGSLAAGALLLELAYPLALASRRARAALAPGSAALLVGIRVFLGPAFDVLLACHVFWIPWARVRGALAAPRRAPLPPARAPAAAA
jgi:hypothetical protein